MTIAKNHQGRHLSPQKPALSDVKGSCHSAPNSALAEVLNGVSKPEAQKGCVLEA